MRFKGQPFWITLAYLLLMTVMGGRTALFVAQFDQLVPLGDRLTALSVIFALALIVALAGASWWRAHLVKGSRDYQIATWTIVGAAILDGLFNVAEAVLLAIENKTFDGLHGIVAAFMWMMAVLIGVGPTLLTVGLASIAGSVDRKAKTKTTARVSGQKRGQSPGKLRTLRADKAPAILRSMTFDRLPSGGELATRLQAEGYAVTDRTARRWLEDDRPTRAAIDAAINGRERTEA